MRAPLILTLDGSTRVCGAALLAPAGGAGAAPGVPDGMVWRVVSERREADNRMQAKLLLAMVDEMLREAEREPADLSAIVVGVGPGTFTGVRIAVATARALGLALHTPVTGISTLSALAVAGVRAAANREDSIGGLPACDATLLEFDRLVPVVDARRGQVFYGVYERGAGGWARSAPFLACDAAALGETVGAGAKPGAATLVVSEDEELVAGLPDTLRLLVEPVDPSRLVIGQDALGEPGEGPEGNRLAAWLADAQGGEPVGAPELVKPIYVRSPDADLHITKMRDPWAEPPAPLSRRAGR